MIKLFAAIPMLILLGPGHYKVQNMLYTPVKVEITCGANNEYGPATIVVPARSEQEIFTGTATDAIMTDCKITKWSKN